jgi:hypothetical protein
MTRVAAYYSRELSTPLEYHLFDNCPIGEQVLCEGVAETGTNGLKVCSSCWRKIQVGEFEVTDMSDR